MNDLIHQEIQRTISGYVSKKASKSNWREPLVSYASASDSLFLELKILAHPGHLLPTELLKGAQSVIAYFLPFEKSICSNNAKGTLASREWATVYAETNELIGLINAHLSDLLRAEGFATSQVPATHNFDPKILMSAWSHRHVAYIAGLGTFGLNRLLITEQGCGGRLGSLVTDLSLVPSPRPEGEFCLYRADGSCTKCVQKCAAKALGRETFDREACYQVLLHNEAILEMSGCADVCGKCSCGLPCSSRNPLRNGRDRSLKT
jgi:epoxyqueuosine reductase QueG